MTLHKMYRQVLLDGSSLECGRLSICLLNNYYPKFNTIRYQVDCDDYRNQFTKLYNSDELDKAVDKYLSLKRKLYK